MDAKNQPRSFLILLNKIVEHETTSLMSGFQCLVFSARFSDAKKRQIWTPECPDFGKVRYLDIQILDSQCGKKMFPRDKKRKQQHISQKIALTGLCKKDKCILAHLDRLFTLLYLPAKRFEMQT